MDVNNVSKDMLMKIIEICNENGISFEIKSSDDKYSSGDVYFKFKRGDYNYCFFIDSDIPFFDVEFNRYIDKMIYILKGEKR